MTAPNTPPEEVEARRVEWDAIDSNGMCTACGAIETRLLEATGVRDLSAIGESAEYPTGYGCELCS